MTPPLHTGPANSRSQTSSTPVTILLADDEAHITCVVAQKLRGEGFDVITARDGEEAYEAACASLPALVITDLQMPRMSGLDLARKLRENPSTSRTPVMMLTARGYIIDPDEALRTNIRHVMGKPFSAREVVRKVHEILGETPRTGTGDQKDKSPLGRSQSPAHPHTPRAEAA